ncbi:MAG TPA: DsbA family oxidoreductase [Stellaceae bacterium]|jgi:predicted DsbA family dithiol-disulfide isomerase|nr:DsbA family oxidoreductase [Stellaceae bacterium]
MQIDIISDVVCPWCFIGKRRLEKALVMRPEIEAAITWRPFQLNPDMPAEGMARADYIATKFGDSGHSRRIHQTIAEAGATVGINFAFDKIKRSPNTRNAHRLVRYATRQGAGGEVVTRLFEGYFLQGRDVGDLATLAKIAAEAGLDERETRAFLTGDAERDEIVAEDRNARRLGVNAVPCFIFAGQYAISGAQEPEFFLPVFDLVLNGAPAPAANP